MRWMGWLRIVLLCLLSAGSGAQAAAAKKGALSRASLPVPAFTLFPPCPCCHVAGSGDGATQIDVRLNPAGTNHGSDRLIVELSNAAGKKLPVPEAMRITTNWMTATVRVPTDTPGLFTITVRVEDSQGKIIAAGTNDIRVVTPQLAKVELGTDGYLRIEGKPSFPLGMYSCSHYDEMGRAGFTGTHSYGIVTGEADDAVNFTDIRLKQLLDNSWSNHMRMMVELPRKAIEKAQWTQIVRRIETFKHHPGLLCWGSEERVARGVAPLKNVRQLYSIAKLLDPDHPLVLGDTRDVIKNLQVDRRDFFPDQAMDAGIWWWYPIPLKAPDASGLEGGATNQSILTPPSWLTTTQSKKPLWIAIQAYQKPKMDSRFPTPEEYRAQAYLSIINGVKGLWFYTGSGQKDYQGKPSGLLNKPQEAHWDYVQKLVRELRGLTDVITSPELETRVVLTPAQGPVEASGRRAADGIYIFAANKSQQDQTARFSNPAFSGRRAQVLFEQREVKVGGEFFEDRFAPLAVHVYKLK